jgi:S-adenosylmethionine:tRNA ribosyltransferase-isomerase
MHSEQFTVSRQLVLSLLEAPLVVAVGTTSLRSLESLYWIGIKLKNGSTVCSLEQWEAYETDDEGLTYPEGLAAVLEHMQGRGIDELHCRTSLLIRPGYRFRSAKGLITNFHQPRSTLLLLIAAFVGPDWNMIYSHALANGYRFLSYGDSSLLWRND